MRQTESAKRIGPDWLWTVHDERGGNCPMCAMAHGISARRTYGQIVDGKLLTCCCHCSYVIKSEDAPEIVG